MALVSALSSAGYKKVLDIMNGDEALKNRGGGRTGGRRAVRDASAGTPPAGAASRRSASWQRPRVGPVRPGRVLHRPAGSAVSGGPVDDSVRRTSSRHQRHVVGANNVLTPSLPAAQPAKYTSDGQTIRPLGDENDKAFALINALTPRQQKQAILNYQVSDLVLGPGRTARLFSPKASRGRR